ncbi:MAG: hypothetical protein RMK21_07450, partial [Aquificaceae bacterium]|nr:hypothetical protein [Aquificaceae bacterium]
LGMHSFSLAGDRMYFSVDFNIVPSCPERKVIYVQPRPEVVLIKPSPIYYYAPQERIVIIEKGKKWKKHPRWDW